MRISSGMAEIGFSNLQSGKTATEKFYLWPQYNAGRVEHARGVTRRTESNIEYFKPTPEDRDRILAQSKDITLQEYSSAGRIARSAPGIRPGSLFEAIV